jgi:hypothetical protein
VVTAWSSSDIAEKYNRLLDKLLSVAELTEQQLKGNVEFEEEKRKMDMQFLQLKLELKKEQLKKIRTGITILYCDKIFTINLQNDYL